MQTKTALIPIIMLITALILLFGCTEEPKTSPAQYFEIVDQKASSFEEIIITDSGEYFIKTGRENLSLENKVITGKINPEMAESLLKQAEQLAIDGKECNESQVMKEIIYFDKTRLLRKCFDLNNSIFDNLLKQSRTSVLQSPQNENYFIHLIYYEKSAASDYHLHKDGLVIKTFYTFSNGLGSAQILSLSEDQVLQLQNLATSAVLIQDSNCGFNEGYYDYVEIQKGDEYNYYIKCPDASSEKQEFYNKARKILEEAK